MADDAVMSGPVEAMAKATWASYQFNKDAKWEALPLIVANAWRVDAYVAYQALMAYIKENQ